MFYRTFQYDALRRTQLPLGEMRIAVNNAFYIFDQFAIVYQQKYIYLFQLVFDVEGLPQKTTLIFNQLELILAPAMCKFVQENTYVNFDWTSQNLTLVSHLYKHL